jgi:hypothetical protein
MNSRRHFLKTSALGAGALAFSPSFSTLLASPLMPGAPKRFVFIRKSNGNRPPEFALPTFSDQLQAKETRKEAFEADLDKHELPSWMRILEGHKQDMTILQGLSVRMTTTGHFSYSSVMGAYKVGRNILSQIKRATIDFELAKLYPSPFGHVELSLAGKNQSGIISGFSAPAPKTRNYCYADPRTAYNELFKSVLNPKAIASENSLLEFLKDEEMSNLKGLSGDERLKVRNHIDSLQSVKDRNRRVQNIAGMLSKHMPDISSVHDDGGPNATLLEKQEAFTDILLASLITGLTNVVCYTIDDLQTPVTGLPGNEDNVISIHGLGHNEGHSGVPADLIREKLRITHMEQVNKIANRLKSVPEGHGTMFDNTMILYFAENGAGHHQPDNESPFVILSGKNVNLDIAGRYIRLPFHATEGHKTLSNWYTTLLNANGNPIPHYGDLDLDMSRKKLDQLGPIKQLMV